MANMVMTSSFKTHIPISSSLPAHKPKSLISQSSPLIPKIQTLNSAKLQLPSLSLKSLSLIGTAAAPLLMALLPALAEVEKASLFDFNLTLPIIMGEFLLLMFALDKIYFSPLGNFMDQRDEALRCISIAEESVASGNRVRALKFIKIAKCLNQDLFVDDLLDACDKLNSASSPVLSDNKNQNQHGLAKSHEFPNEEKRYNEEHAQLIRQIKSTQDYYAILGVEKNCVVEEIRKAYKKLSLKVHPDKNKVPGSEEAFKKVSKAFKCLSNDTSRRQYDQVGLVDEFEHNQRHNVRRRRRRPTNDFFYDDFDPDEIFRAFFSQRGMFRASNAHRTAGPGNDRREGGDLGWPNFMVLLQILPFLLIFLLAYLPFTEPEYSLFKNYSYQVPKMTEKHGVMFFIKSLSFDNKYPPGTAGRANFEDNVIKDYKNMLWRYCHVEMQRCRWSRNFGERDRFGVREENGSVRKE